MLLVKILSLCYHKCCMHKKTMMVSKIAEEKCQKKEEIVKRKQP